jgi:hypothetical protein
MMAIGAIIDIRRSPAQSATLRPGDRLNVRVLEVFENQRALVDLGRFRTLAEIAFPVAAGDDLRVQVIQSGARLRLQILAAGGASRPPEGSTAAAVSPAAGEGFQLARERTGRLSAALQGLPDARVLPAGIRRVADALRLFLNPLEPRSSPATLAIRLRELCEDSGLFLEHRLAAAVRRAGDGTGEHAAREAGSRHTAERILSTDLKSRLLVLRDFFSGAEGRQLARDNRAIERLAQAAADALVDIRSRQEQMIQPAPVQVLHVALPMADDRDRAGLKIAYGRRRNGGNAAGHRAALLLELDRLGAVRADLTLLGPVLTVAVFVSSAVLRDLVKDHAAELHEALAPFFESVAFRVSVSARKIARFAAEDWLAAGETRVDVRI